MSIQIDHVHFAYGTVPVLEDITCHAEEGRLVAILGQNGSGKTTLLKTVDRLLKPSKGCVRVGGVDVADMTRREIARRVGYMPQTQEAVHCTVFEAVLLGRKARKASEPDKHDLEKVEDVLALTRLDHLAMRSTHELSGGELQKVVLARALAQEPKVLLLDEPISHLDPINQIEVMSLLHEVTKGMHMTSLLVTHDLNSALRFADRFIMLKDGQIVAQGDKTVLTPESIKAVYGIDSIIAEVEGIPVLVPLLKGVRAHQHIHEHAHEHCNTDGETGTHAHPHPHRHTHEVNEHVYDHDHNDGHGRHEHEHQHQHQDSRNVSKTKE